MIKKLKLLFPALIASISLCSCTIIKIVDNEDNQSQQDETLDPGTYYKGYDLTRTGGKLIMELAKNAWDKHVNFFSYGQYNTYCSTTTDRTSIEAVGKGSSINQYFYTGLESKGYGTREHVWPCANSANLWVHADNADTETNVDRSTYIGGGSDLLHVRTCTSAVNTKRGNTRFVSYSDVEHQPYNAGAGSIGDGGKWQLKVNEGQKTCEPADGMKGDVARIVAYVYIHYIDLGVEPDGSVKSGTKQYSFHSMVGSLSLQSIFGYDSEQRCQQVMRQWNEMDPPSDVEKLRNDTVQKLQGNRNPFVDFPNLMDQAFQDE